MKSVLAILGLAIAFIALSLVISRPKELKDRPQDTQAKNEAPSPDKAADTAAKPEPFNPPREGVITADLTFKKAGTITCEFYPKAAPKAVAQITGLIKKGFYDGILVHRVDKPLVVQFGNPDTKTAGVDAPETDTSVPMLKFEENYLHHVPGAIGLARLTDKDTATSQLFVDLQNNPDWNGEYCVIGRVVKGMDVVERVERGDQITSFRIKA